MRRYDVARIGQRRARGTTLRAAPAKRTISDENGMPNPDVIREALAADKPHLSRVGGDILQGHRGEESDAGDVDLAGMLRAGA